ncbi:MAG: cytochrome c [Bacteroidetes bacterium]|nr:MAG: cytochrome c [Bacteroidota bacterium]
MKKIPIFAILLAGATLAFLISSCAGTSSLAEAKSGAQLWGENCLRCHNAPSPETFSDTEWDVAVMHMRVRANLTEAEAVKVAEFLKTAN